MFCLCLCIQQYLVLKSCMLNIAHSCFRNLSTPEVYLIVKKQPLRHIGFSHSPAKPYAACIMAQEKQHQFWPDCLYCYCSTAWTNCFLSLPNYNFLSFRTLQKLYISLQLWWWVKSKIDSILWVFIFARQWHTSTMQYCRQSGIWKRWANERFLWTSDVLGIKSLSWKWWLCLLAHAQVVSDLA